MVEPADTSWGEYRRLILSELERTNRQIEGINEKLERFHSEDLSKLRTDIALLKFQAGLWGAVAGALMAAGGSLAVKLVT